MANRTCRSSFGACAIRVARLEPNGVPDPGPNNLYVADTLISVTRNVNVRAGTLIELPDGCGGVCAAVQTPERVQSITLEIELCQHDAELLEMLLGGNIITVLTDTVGYLSPAYNATPPDVSVEFWAQSVTESGQDLADNPYIQFGYPKVNWIAGAKTHDDTAITRYPLTGTVYTNTNFYNGPGNDWLEPFSTAPEGFQFVDALPATQCGYKTLAAS
jgi:hypothetical protein